MRISKRKWSTATGRCTEAFSWPVEVLGTDQHGTWLGSRQGNSVQQPDGRTELQRHNVVWLAIEAAWYLPAFVFSTDTDLTIDLCTPPTFSGETWSFIDLELDLFRRPGGRAGIVDQDEWELLAGSGRISEDEILTVNETARTLLQLVEDRRESFGCAALPWLRSLTD